MKKLTKLSRVIFGGVLIGGIAYCHAAMAEEQNSHIVSIDNQGEYQNTWLDKQRMQTKAWLSNTAGKIDNWFGDQDDKQSAKANLRVMMDTTWNEFDGVKIQPRIRARLKLPTLEQGLSVLVGDETLDDELADGVHHSNHGPKKDEDKIFDQKKAQKENASLAVRWSKFRRDTGIDVDLGVRSNDVFLRVKADKTWRLSDDTQARFEQMYRYGTKSEHTLLSTLEFGKSFSDSYQLINRSHLQYTHRDTEELNWNNSLYQQHEWPAKHGSKTLRYGVYTAGAFENKKPKLDTWGPYVNYRQPILRNWLFVQGEVSYYNHKPSERKHHASLFSRVEVLF